MQCPPFWLHQGQKGTPTESNGLDLGQSHPRMKRLSEVVGPSLSQWFPKCVLWCPSKLIQEQHRILLSFPPSLKASYSTYFQFLWCLHGAEREPSPYQRTGFPALLFINKPSPWGFSILPEADSVREVRPLLIIFYFCISVSVWLSNSVQ